MIVFKTFHSHTRRIFRQVTLYQLLLPLYVFNRLKVKRKEGKFDIILDEGQSVYR